MRLAALRPLAELQVPKVEHRFLTAVLKNQSPIHWIVEHSDCAEERALALRWKIEQGTDSIHQDVVHPRPPTIPEDVAQALAICHLWPRGVSCLRATTSHIGYAGGSFRPFANGFWRSGQPQLSAINDRLLDTQPILLELVRIGLRRIDLVRAIAIR